MLAGGRSERFGKDKLLALIDGRTVIEKVLLNLRPDVGLTTNEERCRLYGFSKCLYDEGRGPAHAVAALGEGEWVVAPGDHPWLKRSTLEALNSFRETFGADVAAPLHDNGVEAVLLSLVDPDSFVVFSGKMTDFIRQAGRAVLVGIALLTRDPLEFAHVNTEESLKLREPKGRPSYELIIMDKVYKKDSVEFYRSLGLSTLARHAKVPLPRELRERG